MLFSIPGYHWPSWFNMAFRPPCPESTKRYYLWNWSCSQNCFGHSSKVGVSIYRCFLIGPECKPISTHLKPIQSGFQAVLSEATFRLTDYGYDTGIKVITSHEHLGKLFSCSKWPAFSLAKTDEKSVQRLSDKLLEKTKKVNGLTRTICHVNWVDRLTSNT